MTKSKIFLALSVSFIVGIAVRSFLQVDFLFFWILCVAAIALLTILYRKRPAVIMTGVLLALALGGAWADRKINDANEHLLENSRYVGQAVVDKDPERKEQYLQLVLRLKDGTRVVATAGTYAGIKYGDELEVSCPLNAPENKGADFDYRMFLAKDGIQYQCRDGSIKPTGANHGNIIYAGILRIKSALARNISSVIPQPEGALATGLLFGGGDQLSAKVANDFSRTGMTHIIAVSGYNVTIIAEYLILLGIFLGLWRKQAFWFAIVGIGLFVVMVGLPASAVRAGVMGGTLLWAMKHGRLANSLNAILLAAVVMLALNPLLLRWDVGFQLSFLATIGIILLAPLWESQFVKKHNALGLLEIVLLSISAQVFVVPVILLNFHTFSVVSLLANVLILPIVPISMLLVFLTAVVGLVSQLFSSPLAWLAFLLLKYEVLVIEYLSSWRWASVEMNGFKWSMMLVWYGVLLGAIYLANQWRQRRIAETAKVSLCLTEK
ncbi:ComEC family competence protein [Patescibacteria group bacterium]|nr:MAG: ComEC family competence protein [Patescibacteria group bacterium]